MDNNIKPSSQQLFSAPQNDIIQWNRKKYKSKVSEKEKYNDDYVTKHISKLRKATYRKDGRYQVVVNKNGKKKTIYGKSPYKANCMADIYEAEDNVELHKILTIPKYRFLFCYSFFRWRNYMLFYSCLEKSTVERYENTYKKYIAGKSIDNTDVRKLDTKHLTQFFFSVLDEKESISTKDYQAIRHIIKGCIDFVYDQELDEEEDEEPSLDWDKVKRKIPKGKIYSKKRVERTVSKSSKNELDSKITSTKKDVKKVEKLSDYSKEPVKAETKEVNKVSSYGTAFAPLFISIALWVGSLMSFIVLFFDKEKRFGLFGIDSKKRVKRTLAYHGLATVSGLVLGLLLQLLLDFDITNVFLYYISIILISNCFLAIIEFLIECFGDIGKFVALIILVLQLGASGGTFPIETVTKGFRFLNPMLPMTYTIRLLKESLISIESSLLSKNFIIVFAIFIVFFIANVALNLYRERKDK